jgi:PAS domain-containing protein
MLWFFTFSLLLLSLAFFRHIFRLRRLLRELEDSVHSQRRLITEDSAETLRKIGALGLVDSLNELMDSHNQLVREKSDYSKQIDAMLGAVQEAVIVFNEDHVVEYANRSSEKLFREGLPIQGLRLEGGPSFAYFVGTLRFRSEARRRLKQVR